ncbi:von Willebrand factor type A domain-containing protein [uncultured Polaribacter sp.]|uniref:YfbK domain-containing protein n=1 Tax=uncultured Polaribacter sp. TaxID=174711 RepID=UPI002618671E|nr:von Willebrand factor type A domain-containing protein [uncultured Polaribacter sp.]
MIKQLFFVILIFGISIIQAQQKEITGIVTDENNQGLPGVSVLIKGTTNGTETNFDGNYVIKAKIGDTLVFTYLGFKKAYKTVAKSSIINVELKADASVLDEIVIVGYGTQRKQSITGAVSYIKAESRKSNPAHNKITKALQGKVSGVNISNNTISTKEIKSTKNKDQPLYIVDGIPVQNNYNSLIQNINPKDIEKVNIYKPKKAEKLFGYAARNGCIVIRTKKGNYKIENDESYAQIHENNFERAHLAPLSTFSIDVDKASYSNIRRMINNGQKIPLDAVKIEEMVNYFDYAYAQPTDKHPFSIHTEVVKTPWNQDTKLVRIGLQGKKYEQENLPASNLTFLIDVSGSMGNANKLPLLKAAFKLLVNQLRKKDKVSIVVYAGAAGVVLKPTSGNQKEKIIAALDHLQSGGSTAGGEGIELAYKLAEKNFKKNGNNRVILATDGDFNVGASSNRQMEKLIVEKRKSGIFLSVLGFGYGNYKDEKLEILADKGNGNHAYIDTMQEAQKVFGEEFGGTLYTIAKDVKIQVEFNPNKVQAYRLIGYENRLLNDEDFIDDTKDAGELGSGHKVTALYEIIPVGVENDYLKKIPKLKYTKNTTNNSEELFTVKFRYKKPSESKSIEIIHIQKDEITAISNDMHFASAVALFGMQLRKSKYYNSTNLNDVLQLAQKGRGEDKQGYRAEFIRLVKSYSNEI